MLLTRMSSRCISIVLKRLHKLRTRATNMLWSTEQRQERILRNKERMQSLGLHKLAQTSSKAVINHQAKQKRAAAKPKEQVPQRSYSLRNRTNPADGAPHQAQSSQVPFALLTA